jgi:4'-phosphopantetheinyl transferase
MGWISLSHSGDHLLLAWSARPIGVDLEAMERPVQALALVDRFFPPQERRQLQGLDGADLRRAVLESWVHKEAAIKWCGGSLAADLAHWSWDHRLRLLVDLRRRRAVPSRCELRRGWLCAAVGEAVDVAEWG